MRSRSIRLLAGAVLAMAVLGAGCAPAQPSPPRAGEATGPGASGPRGTLKIAYDREPPTLSSKFLGGGGAGEFAWIFNSTLTFYDSRGVPHPLIAREIPTQERGDWIVRPDGTMVTTYRLRENARWHDGAPLTAHDFVFAFEVYLDPQIPVVSRTAETRMSRVEAPDPHTLVIHWSETFPGANVLGYQELNPLPRHLLEEKYRNNRANFAVGEEWTTAYIGSGPFRLEQWTPGSNMIARAHLGWLLARRNWKRSRFASSPIGPHWWPACSPERST